MINSALVKKYRPDGIITADEACCRLNDGSMKNNEYPAVFLNS
jgi:hypothetical protein